jgi:hypothetical protein
LLRDGLGSRTFGFLRGGRFMTAVSETPRMTWAIAALGAVGVLVLGAAVVLWLTLSGQLEDGQLYALILLGAAGLLAIIALLRRAARSTDGGLALTAGPAAPWAPIFATISTVFALFLLRDPTADETRRIAVAVGFGLGLAAWAVAVWDISFRSKPRTVNARAFADLMGKYRAVQTRYVRARDADPAAPWVVEAERHLAWVRAELGVPAEPPAESQQPPTPRGRATQSGVDWASGYGYVNVSMALHRAEEALVLVASRNELDAIVLHDRLRTSGSRITHLVEKVRRARRTSPAEERARATTRAAPEPVDANEVAAVRQAINEFRDSRWDGLARARNRLNYTSLITAWTAYLVLVVAVALDAPREAIGAGIVFFLVGALVGLFAQLWADARTDEAVEDFGLSAARLRQTVIVSGLAAVGGVLITAMVADATALQRGETPPSLSEVFSVSANPAPLLIAAVFGLSPQLLIERLSANADRYRADLTQTGTSDTERLPEDEATQEVAVG